MQPPTAFPEQAEPLSAEDASDFQSVLAADRENARLDALVQERKAFLQKALMSPEPTDWRRALDRCLEIEQKIHDLMKIAPLRDIRSFTPGQEAA